ncbi:MAG: FHA domain-containing protein [Gemmatimonadales bacterium]|nr:FHA domain-containing protein [Gemmatimonadales bacterium]
MIHLEVGGRRVPVPAEPLVLGSAPDAGVRLEGEGILARHAIFDALGGGGVAVRAAEPDALVLVNGVRLGHDPTPLLHGDKVTVAGHEIRVTDDRRAGSTQLMAAFTTGEHRPPPSPAAAAAPLAGPTLNGRLVCLTDGREYQVPDGGLVLGRDASCDVVLLSEDVSRRHAEIRPGPAGYVLTDSSANGTLVNGQRISGVRVLARADIIRIGTDELRFYADPAVAAAAAAAPPAAVGARQRRNDTMHGIPTMPPPSMQRPALNDTLHGIPSTPPPGGAPAPSAPLASLLVRSGTLKGQRLPVRAPVVNLGRADYNDVVLPEPSVSTAHAKLQRREGVWVVSDLGSTNGTLVDGERVEGEVPLSPGATLKLGEVALLIEPMDAAAPREAGTHVLRSLHDEPERPPRRPRPEPASEPAPAAKASPVAIVLFVILVAAAAALVFLR